VAAALSTAAPLSVPLADEGGLADATAAAIRAEALAPETDERRPLPLAASWDATARGFSPDWQMRMIARGHHLLPTFAMPWPDGFAERSPQPAYYADALAEAARLRLPICLLGTQWERVLYDDPRFLAMPPEVNANVLPADCAPRAEDASACAPAPMVSPFGAIAPWRDAGAAWGAGALMGRLQAVYPDPPLVLFVSNNEPKRLLVREAERDRRTPARLGPGAEDARLRRAFAEGWIARYRALQQGLRAHLTSPAWRANARFVAYNAGAPGFVGRWPGWTRHTLHGPHWIDPSPLMWDGGSISAYLTPWDAGRQSDDRVWSPQVEASGRVPLVAEARRLNPSFWLEVSTWTGDCRPHCAPGKDGAWAPYRPLPDVLAERGQSYTPERYHGLVQFLMWMLRPRVVRDYRYDPFPPEEDAQWYAPVIDAVDRVHADPVLRAFWRSSSLVADPKRPHPYAARLPAGLEGVQRMYLLATDRDPPAAPEKAAGLDAPLPVAALARVRGQPPGRSWLLYLHAPAGAETGVEVRVPDYGPVRVDAAVGGTFYLLEEDGGRITALDAGPRFRP
jgi:hypothetical protein